MRIGKYKDWAKGYYHLSTDGRWDGTIFHNDALFAYGMILVGLLTLLYPVKIYAFVLMDNHIHIILSGTGQACTKAFHYLVRKLNIRLRENGFPPLPDNYGFKLVPIENQEQLKNEILYLDRNPYEKQLCIPGGYPWGTAGIHHSRFLRLFKWTKASEMSKRELERLYGSRVPIPGDWEFNTELGLNPASFVCNDKFKVLFPTPKSYESRLAKDYEAFVKVAEKLEEEIVFSPEEIDGILNNLLRVHFSARKLVHLDNGERARLAVMLSTDYHIPSTQIADALHIQEYLVKQFLGSKDFGKRK